MTTPHERRRNLIWGREALEEMSADANLPRNWRDTSAELLSRYPSLARLKDCGDDGLQPLQGEFADGLAAARDFFQRVRVRPPCSKERSYSLLVILRHFY